MPGSDKTFMACLSRWVMWVVMLISDRLAFLHAATCIDDMDKPGYRLHESKGKLKGHWAINVSGNWRIVFNFVDGDAHVVNYEDYH